MKSKTRPDPLKTSKPPEPNFLKPFIVSYGDRPLKRAAGSVLRLLFTKHNQLATILQKWSVVRRPWKLKLPTSGVTAKSLEDFATPGALMFH